MRRCRQGSIVVVVSFWGKMRDPEEQETCGWAMFKLLFMIVTDGQACSNLLYHSGKRKLRLCFCLFLSVGIQILK